MKKLQLLFSLCLAFIFSLSAVRAQSGYAFPRLYHPADRISEIANGMRVTITATGQGGTRVYHAPEEDFMHLKVTANDTANYSSKFIDDNAFFIIEEVGTIKNEVTKEEHTTYRLKHEASGLYLTNERANPNGDGSDYFRWTPNAKDAFVFTALHPEGYTEDSYQPEGEDPLTIAKNPRARVRNTDSTRPMLIGYEHAFVMCDTQTEMDNDGDYTYSYLCAYEPQYAGYFGPYNEVAMWAYMTVAPYDESEYFEALQGKVFNEMFPNGFSPNDYPIGNTIGMYPDQTLLDNLAKAWAAFEKFCEDAEAGNTYDKCAAIYQQLYDAKNALEASIIDFKDGEYYIIVGHRFKSGNYVENGKIYTTWNYAPQGISSELTFEKDAKHIWQVHKAEDGNGFYLQNYMTKAYATYPGDASSDIVTTTDPVTAFQFPPNTQNASFKGYFNICPTENLKTGWATLNNKNNLCYWGGLADDDGNQFKFYAVSEDVIAGFESLLEQDKLNKELKDIFFNASTIYNKERIYTSDEAQNDGVFSTTVDGKITNASQISSNAQEMSEGSIEGLLDGDFTTYFCSAWHSEYVPAGEYHCLDLDLGEKMQVVTLKYARRQFMRYNTTPNKVNIYATNDTTAAGKWNFIGTYTFKNNVASTYQRTVNEELVDTLMPNSGGMTGFDLGEAYQHIRMEVVSTVDFENYGAIGGVSLNGFPLFTMTELRAYSGKFDEAASKAFMAVSEPVRNALDEALKVATTAYINGTATREIIDNLKKAYDNFVNEFADTEIAKNALNDTKAKLSAYKNMIGEEIGMFPEEAKDAADKIVADVEEYINDIIENNKEITLEKIKELVAQLEEAVTTLDSSLILPEVGKIYAIRGVTNADAPAKDRRNQDALIYASGNGSAIKMVVDTLLEIDPAESLNYLWKVEECGNGQIALRNVATGFYIDTIQNSTGASLRNVEEKALINYQSAMIPGGFKFIIGQEEGEDYYATFQGGQGTTVVTWNYLKDASNFKFEEVDAFTPGETSEELYATWPTVRNGYQVMTLPFDIYYVVEESAKAYKLLGEKAGEGDASPTLELKEYPDCEVIEAGTPFILQTIDTISYTMNLNSYDPYEISYVFEGGNSENGAITGSIKGETLAWDVYGKGIFRNGELTYVKSDANGNRNVPGNSGYINYVETTETGDAHIELTGGSLTTGIAGGVIVDNNAKVDVYTISGVQVRKNVKAANATKGLPAGIYVVGGNKVLVK